jgi:hypothetical protein
VSGASHRPGGSDIDMALDTDGEDSTPSPGPRKKSSRSWKTLGEILPTNLTEAELVTGCVDGHSA